MIEIIFIEIISIVSFLYSIFMMFISFAEPDQMAVLFLWTLSAAFVYALLHTKSKLYEISSLLFLVPLIFYREISAFIFIVATSILIFLYLRNSLYKGAHHVYVDRIKKSYLVYIPLIYARFLLEDFSLYVNGAIPFIIVYFLSSIILARSIRHLDSNMDMGNIRKNNIKYSIIISFVFALTAFEKFRDSFLILVEQAISLVYYPFYLMGQVVGFIFDRLNMEEGVKEKPGELLETTKAEELAMEEIERFKQLAEKPARDFTILKNIIGLALIMFVIYIIYRMIKKEGDRRQVGSGYVEEREYIHNKKEKKKRFARDKYPTELKEQIRYYYRKFLKKLIKNDAKILKSDSTLEIDKKAKRVLEKKTSRIREIYIRSRYSAAEVDQELLEEIRREYKEL
nr:hypothetical protein [Tissierella sp.]